MDAGLTIARFFLEDRQKGAAFLLCFPLPRTGKGIQGMGDIACGGILSGASQVSNSIGPIGLMMNLG